MENIALLPFLGNNKDKIYINVYIQMDAKAIKTAMIIVIGPQTITNGQDISLKRTFGKRYKPIDKTIENEIRDTIPTNVGLVMGL
jgi:hypothetical protein